MRVSAIIPAYNAEAFLRDAVDSVLRQSVAVEVVVVDDGSSDATPAIIASYGARVRAVRQAQCGLGAARNTGLRESCGEWVAFLDADDLWTPDKIALQISALEAQSDADMVFGHCVEFSSPGGPAEWAARTTPFAAYSACAMLARRTLFERVGGFSESRELGEFIGWYSRARDAGAKSVMLQEVVFHRRVHASNMTRLARGDRHQYLEVVRAHLQRGRSKE